MKEYMQRHEMAFIEGIGRWSKAGSRIRCLRGYLASLDRRTDWFDGVNVEALRRKAQSLLAEAGHGQAAA